MVPVPPFRGQVGAPFPRLGSSHPALKGLLLRSFPHPSSFQCILPLFFIRGGSLGPSAASGCALRMLTYIKYAARLRACLFCIRPNLSAAGSLPSPPFTQRSATTGFVCLTIGIASCSSYFVGATQWVAHVFLRRDLWHN